MKARSVPFSLLSKIETEINNLVKQGVLEKVDSSEWASPIVPVQKSNGDIRICGDYKQTLNPNLQIDEHPLSTVDEIFSKMAGGNKFTKIYLNKAYLHLEFKSEMREYLTLNTHRGLYKCNRLMFGVASAPAIWQRAIEQILQGIPGTSVFIDDIKVTGSNTKEHLQNLEKVLIQLEEHNLKINLSKSTFLADEIHYCGYLVNKDGIHKTKEKIEAIVNMPLPKNVTELRSFIGLVQYYTRFSSTFSTILFPLNQLTHKNTPWKWTNKHTKVFNEIKRIMQSDSFLIHYDPNLPLVLATDASPYGVGAILSHICPDGSERPIKMASQTFTETQRKYAQIDKEAFAIVYGIKKFYQYLFGNKFILYTDHAPLVQIFSPSKCLPVLTATRMQHYAIFLQAFNFEIKYKKSKDNANADALSRLPLQIKDEFDCDEPDVYQIHQINTLQLHVKAEELARETKNDKTLQKLLAGLQSGFIVHKLDRFNIDQTQFSLQNGVILRGHGVVVPQLLRNKVLIELHTAHFGIVKMKQLARSYCWWPNIDSDIEKMVKGCYEYQKLQKENTKVDIHPWEESKRPFDRVHVDFAGPFNGNYYFLLVDAFSRWPEIHLLKTITAETTIETCNKIFSTFGIPTVMVSDNGPQFTSYKFKSYLASLGITQKFTAPYHPATNGLAERMVQTLKKALRAMRQDNLSRSEELYKLLLQYRKMNHSVTGESPAKLMLGHEIRTKIDLIKPEFTSLTNFTRDNKVRTVEIGSRVSVRDYYNEKWKFGKVIERIGLLHYIIQLDDNRKWKRHIDQIRSIGENVPNENLPQWEPSDITTAQPFPIFINNKEVNELPVQLSPRKSQSVSSEDESEIYNNFKDISTNFKNENEQMELRGSTRARKPPNRLDL